MHSQEPFKENPNSEATDSQRQHSSLLPNDEFGFLLSCAEISFVLRREECLVLSYLRQTAMY